MITGLICPKSKERKEFADCLICAQTEKHKCHYTYSIIKEIIRGIQERDKYHCTMLTKCLRSVYYEFLYDLYPKIEQLFYFFRGRAFHEKLETDGEEYFHEIKVSRDLVLNPDPPEELVTLKGAIDEINFEKGLVRDFKSTKAVPTYPNAYSNHILQLNIYLYLLQKDDRWKFGWEPQFFEVTYFEMSCPKRCKVKVMDYIKLDTLIREKLSILEQAFKSNTAPLRKLEDLWGCQYCYAREQCERDYIIEIKQGKYDTELL